MNTLKYRIRILVTAALMLAGVACRNEQLGLIEEPGVIPSSTEQVVDMFELKYGEIKEWGYDGRIFRFSIKDIDDQADCFNSATGYVLPEVYNSIEIHAYLHVETDGKAVLLKVSAKRCGEYGRSVNYGLDNVWRMLEFWQFDPANQDGTFFRNSFAWAHGEGTLWKDTSLSIFMGYTHLQDNQEDNKSMYKFFFIITN
jgi:hypothetical protein